ncbi:MAG: prepilin-type N-terminal cleavage/methylation domain-containing protein [Planctomycetes bacterium]|nr:prepilin-type N-terminal cleavage/methylation domain-containing protein [Planctomycetota bacterium]
MIHGSRTRSSGFTLIELLIVVAIIGTLLGILLPTLGVVRERGKAMACLNEIRQIETALSTYEGIHRDYPPSTLTGIGIRGDGVNEGNETLLACLTTEQGGPFWEVHEDKLVNTDEDKAPRDISTYTRSTIRTNALYEIADPWQNPYVYLHGSDIAKTFRAKYLSEFGVQDVRAVTEGEKKGITPGEGKYQIWSFGSNGVNDQGLEDDIVSWKSK